MVHYNVISHFNFSNISCFSYFPAFPQTDFELFTAVKTEVGKGSTKPEITGAKWYQLEANPFDQTSKGLGVMGCLDKNIIIVMFALHEVL